MKIHTVGDKNVAEEIKFTAVQTFYQEASFL